MTNVENKFNTQPLLEQFSVGRSSTRRTLRAPNPFRRSEFRIRFSIAEKSHFPKGLRIVF